MYPGHGCSAGCSLAPRTPSRSATRLANGLARCRCLLDRGRHLSTLAAKTQLAVVRHDVCKYHGIVPVVQFRAELYAACGFQNPPPWLSRSRELHPRRAKHEHEHESRQRWATAMPAEALDCSPWQRSLSFHLHLRDHLSICMHEPGDAGSNSNPACQVHVLRG